MKLRKKVESLRHKVHNKKGHYSGAACRIGIVVSEFNEYLTYQLLEGALDTLVRNGVRVKNITVVYVPGAYEIPLAAKKLISRQKLDAVITLAVVIKGQTKHFDQVVEATAYGLQDVALRTEVPVILGIIPAMNVEQALERVGIKHMNKGREWALSALEMANLIKDRTVKLK